MLSKLIVSPANTSVLGYNARRFCSKHNAPLGTRLPAVISQNGWGNLTSYLTSGLTATLDNPRTPARLQVERLVGGTRSAFVLA